MNVNQTGAGPCGSDHTKSHTDGVTNTISKRFLKNTVCQVNRVQNQLPGRGKRKSRGELQLLRLSQKNFPVSEKMKESFFFNDSIDQRCDDNRNNQRKLKKSSEINEDWGKRTELHNIFHVNDGDKVWNIIRRGLFAEIKLYKNSYGSFSCKASGKISVRGIPEKSIIEINTLDNLRKLLGLSHMQWSALCEAIEEKEIALAFSAFDEVDMNKISSLEKLWFFICKRRHFLPNICVMGKLSGAVRLMKELKIVPKVVITEIRDFKGEEIS